MALILPELKIACKEKKNLSSQNKVPKTTILANINIICIEVR